MTPIEWLEQWWASVGAGPVPTKQQVLDLVGSGGMDAGTGAMIYVILLEAELAP